MVDVKKIFERKLNIADGVFKIDAVYKGIKQKSDSLGYTLVEKEHSNKSGKYGGEIKFDFILDKEIDYFAKGEISVEIIFLNIKKAKGYDVGNIELKMSAMQKLDYKHRWGINKFNKFLFSIYQNLMKENFKKKYLIPIIIDATTIYNFIKESIEEYG
ncbi:hypothetical protein J4440_01480 [Candidatus Woesearchaeota archaeon]|nr:hypothetical protein [Candidatus Woesearchaeota archaeon]